MKTERKAAMRGAAMALALTLSTQAAIAAPQQLTPSPSGIENFVRDELSKTEIPGASITIIHHGRVVWSRGIGVANKESRQEVDRHTIFQAASISKAFTAIAALRLVEAGRLSLDGDVNDVLQGWKLRDEQGNLATGVSLRMLLSHTAGTSVSGLRGYDLGQAIPSLSQILDGAPPANNRSVRVTTPPNTAWRYSGGGYLVIQRLIEQVTGEPLASYLNRTVLSPLGMRDSIFAQPLPAALRQRAASGYLDDGAPVPGGARTYPETAAAGLWTTPDDLAKFVLALQRGIRGEPGALLSQPMMQTALQDQRNHMGLGLFLEGESASLRFHHGGRNQGFDSEMVGYANAGEGAVIMLDANDTSGMLDRILHYIGEAYHWSDYPPLYRPALVDEAVERAPDWLGHYEGSNGRLITIRSAPNGALMVRQGVGHGAYYDRLIGGAAPVGVDHPEAYRLVRGPTGQVTAIERLRHDNPDPNQFARIGGLAERALVDPDPSITANVLGVFRHLATERAQDQAVLNASPGFVRDMGVVAATDLAPIAGLRFVGREDTRGRSINRHDTEVVETRTYLVEGAPGAVIVYFDADGQVCDYDLVEA